MRGWLRLVRATDRALCDHAALALVLALQAAFLAALVPYLLHEDTWLTLVAGRDVWQHGIPTHDVLAVWTAGRTWIDQQWLAQLVFYAADRVGGLASVFVLHLVALTAALGLAMATARKRGASGGGVFLIALIALLVAPWSWQPRAQSLAEVPYVLLLALLLRERADGPGRRVLLALPLLVLWANLHGSVVIGVALVLAYAVLGLVRERGCGRIYLPLLLSPLCLLVTPYGVHTIHYYGAVFGNNLAALAPEWQTPHGREAIGFFLLAAVAVVLLLRGRRRLTTLELVVFVLTLGASLTAVRFFVWFALAMTMILPPFLRTPPLRVPAPVSRCGGWICATAVVGVVGALLVQPGSWYEREWPAHAGRALVAAERADRDGAIFVHGHEADWLLWRYPSLEGRIAYDARLELLSSAELQQVVRFDRREGRRWPSVTDGYAFVWVNSEARPEVASALARQPGSKLIYRDRQITLLRRAAGSPISASARTASARAADS